MDKQIYDLTPDDLSESPMWYFPMDATVEDEATVRPVQPRQRVPSGLQMIVRCRFEDASGRVYPGYVYVDDTQSVEAARPVLWAGQLCVTFWNGMVKPKREYLARVARAIPAGAWPIRYRSEANLCVPVMSGFLEGIYFIEDSDVRVLRV